MLTWSICDSIGKNFRFLFLNRLTCRCCAKTKTLRITRKPPVVSQWKTCQNATTFCIRFFKIPLLSFSLFFNRCTGLLQKRGFVFSLKKLNEKYKKRKTDINNTYWQMVSSKDTRYTIILYYYYIITNYSTTQPTKGTGFSQVSGLVVEGRSRQTTVKKWLHFLYNKH